MNTRIIVDSSGWLEFFGGTKRGELFLPAIRNTNQLIVPVISIYEVFKHTVRELGETAARQIAATMQRGLVIDLNVSLAFEAAENKLPLADSIIYATALRHGCELWTQDSHFEHLPHVRYFPKKENS